MSIKQSIIHRLRNGIRVPFTEVRVGFSIARPPAKESAAPGEAEQPPAKLPRRQQTEAQIIQTQVHFIIEKFSELRNFMPEEPLEPGDYYQLYDFVNEYLPLILPDAREVQIRRLLYKLRSRVAGEEYKNQLTREIARSDYRNGVIERATLLLEPDSVSGSEQDPELRRELESRIEEFEKHYEAKVPLIKNQPVWREARNDVRGNSLLDLFTRHPEQISGKKILHIAPEPDLKEWFNARLEELNLEYETLNGFGDGETYQRDIGSMGLPANHYDLVICHRVLEHIVDDASAIQEVCKIIRPGGTFNTSVPQSMHLADTREWIVPDTTHALHVRQYGRDFVERLRAGGFQEVNVEYALLEKTMDEHKRDHTYPMRIYNCRK